MTSAASSPSDQALLDAFLRDGDEGALRRVVERLTPALFRVARGLTGWRMLGAQTVVERAWQVALRNGDQLAAEERGLLRLLLREIVERAQAMGDSPQPQLSPEPERAEAMRAVALLPAPSRAVFVLHDIGGLSSAWVAELLGQPLARVVAELWHARLAVETLRGNAAEPLAPEGTDEPGEALEGVAPLWLEDAPAELLDRIVANGVHRRATIASRPTFMGRRLDLAGTILAASVALLGAGAWGIHEARGSAAVADAAAPAIQAAPLELPGQVVTATKPATTPVRQAAASRRERDARPTLRPLPRPTGGPAGAVAGRTAPAAVGTSAAAADAERLAAAVRDSARADSVAPRAPRSGGGGGAAAPRSGKTAFVDETRRFEPPPGGPELLESGRAGGEPLAG